MKLRAHIQEFSLPLSSILIWFSPTIPLNYILIPLTVMWNVCHHYDCLRVCVVLVFVCVVCVWWLAGGGLSWWLMCRVDTHPTSQLKADINLDSTYGCWAGALITDETGPSDWWCDVNRLTPEQLLANPLSSESPKISQSLKESQATFARVCMIHGAWKSMCKFTTLIVKSRMRYEYIFW